MIRKYLGQQMVCCFQSLLQILVSAKKNIVSIFFLRRRKNTTYEHGNTKSIPPILTCCFIFIPQNAHLHKLNTLKAGQVLPVGELGQLTTYRAGQGLELGGGHVDASKALQAEGVPAR